MAAADYKALVQSIYISYFGRPADTFGLANFSAQLDALHAPTTVNGLTAAYSTTPALKSLIDSFGSSAESTSLYGTDTVAFVSAIYNNVLNRAPDFDGLVFWVTEINAGHLTKANASLAIMAGAINNTTAQGVIDAQVLANKVTIATNFTTSIDTGAELAAYNGNAAAAVARDMLKSVTSTTVPATFQATVDATLLQLVNGSTVGATIALTSGIDNVVGTSGNDTFNAVPTGALNSASFTSLDSINGGAGNDTLIITSVTDLDLASAAGATVTGVENVTLASSGQIINADVSGWTGLTNLTLSSTQGTFVTGAAATTNVSELASIAQTEITGGNNVTVIHKTSGDVIIDQAAGNVKVTSSAGTVSVTNSAADVNVAAKGTIIGSGKTFTGTALGATTQATQDADSAAANITAAGAKSSAISADGSAAGKVAGLLTLTGGLNGATDIASNNLATFTAYKAGIITQAQKVAMDAAFSAAINTPGAVLADAVAATLAIETPLVTAANAAKAITAANVITTTGAYNDAVAVYSADTTAAGRNVAAGIHVDVSSKILTKASVEGNFLGSTNIADASTLGTVLTAVSLSNSGSASLSGNALTNVSLKDQFSSVTVTNNTALHAINVTLDDVAGITFSDGSADKVIINAVSDSDLTFSNGVATSVVVTGAGHFVFDGAAQFAANAAIDASANAGGVGITVTAGQSFVGGAGNDSVTAGSAIQTAKLDGGAGNDKLVLTANANFATAAAAAKFVNFETLQLNTGVSADVTAFTGSTLTGVVLNGATKVIGLNAAQAGNLTVKANGTYEIGVAGATTVGQLDTVKMIVSDGSSTHNTITMTTPDLAGVEVLNMTATDNIVITSLTKATALTNINVDGAGTTSITTGAVNLNVNTVIDAHATTRAVTVDASAALANGLKIIGTASTGVNTLTANNFASVLVGGQGADVLKGGFGSDVITSGNGNNTITSGAVDVLNIGGDTVLLGNGANSVTLNGSGAATVTVGNGYNTIVTGAGNDKIIVGTGGNSVTGGAGADIITFGAHVAGVVDQINYSGAAGETFSGAFTSGVSTNAGIDIVTGMHAGDLINITGAGITTGSAVGTTLAAGAGALDIVKGNFDLTTHIFTVNASGTDSMVQWDADGAGPGTAVNDVILVGFTGTVVAGTNALILV